VDSFLLILDSFKTVFSLATYFWWVYLPILLYCFAYLALKNYTNLKYRLSLEWVLLEIRTPKEINKSLRAMDQIFTSLHGIYSVGLKWHAILFKGAMPEWFSFEIVGKAGETHFYIRTLSKYKNLVEAQVYAQYPDSEIFEVPDYVNEMPLYLPDDKYDLWGTELILNKEDAYPIRTYPDFEEKTTGPDVVKRIDPLASFSELFSTLHHEERIWIQIIANPVSDAWAKRGQAVIAKLMGIESPAQGDFLSNAVFAIDKAISQIGPTPTVDPDKKPEKKEEKKKVDMTPGKQDAIKAIEKSFDKLGYEAGIRFVYIGPKSDFHQAHVSGVAGAFKQFASQNLNGFKPNLRTLTFAKGLFKKSKLYNRKRILYQSIRERKLMTKRYVLNTEELATIFHFPDTAVKSPLLPRVEAKKGEPPVGLPLS